MTNAAAAFEDDVAPSPGREVTAEAGSVEFIGEFMTLFQI
jgi:hypothetical protein